MSTRGRGRGAGSAKATDRTSSSSRDSSLTRSTPSTTSNIEVDDRLLKQYTTKTTAGSSATPNIGGSSRPAAKFTPNLAASKKDKDKSDTSVTIPSSSSNNDHSSQKRKDFSNGNRSQQSRGAHHNARGGANSRGNYMQMEGIFQGNAQIPASMNSSSSSRFSSVKREPSSSTLRTPNIKKLGTAKTVLIGDVDGLKYEIDEEYEPRRIPLAERKSIFESKQESTTTQKHPKPSSTDSDHLKSFINLFSQQKLESTTKSLVKEEPVEQNELPPKEETMPDPSQLILMQFPDVLPCTRTSSTATTPELVSLSDLPDGFLGKLQIYKSGKCRLKLSDDTYLDVDIGQPTSFLQNVMVTQMASSTTNSTLNDQGTNDMNKLVCLGDIKHKLIVSLDVDHVLQDTRQ